MSRTKALVQMAIFSALIIVLAFTPFIGYIPLGFTRATIIHIPVIIGSLMMGPKKGAVLGGVFGLTSFINNTMNPTLTSFVFTPFYSLGEYSGGIGSVIICFIPRSYLPEYVVKDDLQSGRLVSLPVSDIDVHIWKQLLHHRDKWISPQIQCVLDYCMEREF